MLGMRRLSPKLLLLAVGLSIGGLIILFNREPKHRHQSKNAGPSHTISPLRKQESHQTIIEDIPHIIHQTWRTHDVPILLKPWIETWLKQNPTWEYWFWTDEDIRNLIQVKFPQFLYTFDSYPSTGYRADVFRYFVLYEYGGVYADLDMESLRPLDELTLNYPCLLSQEPAEHAHFLSPFSPPLVSNALMMCKPGHPFFENVLDNLGRNSGVLFWKDVHTATGPYMLTKMYNLYSTDHVYNWMKKSLKENPITLATPDQFHPTIDKSMLDYMQSMCLHPDQKLIATEKLQDRHKALCSRIKENNIENKIPKTSFTNHHWTHMWAGPKNDPWGVFNSDRTFNIKSLSRKLQYNG